MERADDTALNHRPETFDGVGMNRADHIFPVGVIDHAMPETRIEAMIGRVVIGRKQTDSVGYGLRDELLDGFGIGMFDHLGDHASFAAHGPDDWGFAMRPARPIPALVFMLVLPLAADVRFINFDESDQLAELNIPKASADSMAHGPSGAVRPGSDCTMDLQSRHALFACQHHVNHTEPRAKRIIGVLEDRPDKDGEAVAVRGTVMALPVVGAAFQGVYLVVSATGAQDALGPAVGLQVLLAVVISREKLLELRNRHLVNLAGLLLHFAASSIRSWGTA